MPTTSKATIVPTIAAATVPAFDVVVGSVLSGDEVEVAVSVAVCPLVFVPAARVAVAVMEGG